MTAGFVVGSPDSEDESPGRGDGRPEGRPDGRCDAPGSLEAAKVGSRLVCADGSGEELSAGETVG